METRADELLVHIAAPSRALDDKRYIAVAKAIRDFRPAVITRVSGPDTDSPSTPSKDKPPPSGKDDSSVITRLVPVVF